MIYTNDEGVFHMVNGPAIEFNGDYTWGYNGLIHRYYGPARHWSWAGEGYFMLGEEIKKDAYFIFGEEIK